MTKSFSVGHRLPDAYEQIAVTRRLGLPDDGARLYNVFKDAETGKETVLPDIGGGADGIYYRDRRTPFATADYASVTIGTAQKMLWLVGATSPTILPANYFYPGKTVKLTAHLKWTAVASVNPITVGMAYASADADTTVVSSGSLATVSSTTTFSILAQGYATCRTVGTAGSLTMFGNFIVPVAFVASTVQTGVPFPVAGATSVASCDTTIGTKGIYFHGLRGTSGADTVIATDIIFEALN